MSKNHRSIYCSNCPYEWDCTMKDEVDRYAETCSEYEFRKELEAGEYDYVNLLKSVVEELGA